MTVLWTPLKRTFLLGILLALIVFALVPAYSQEIDCREEIFRVSRQADNCRLFFCCMIGGRVDFFCDEGYIFDPDQIVCRPGYEDTCEYATEVAPHVV